MSKERMERVIKKYDRITIWLFVIAALFLSYGLYHYFYLGAKVVTHPKVPQPSLSNGAPTIFFGVIFVVLATYRTIRRSKLLKQVYDLNKSND